MIDFDKELQAILADDPLGLLDVKPQANNTVTADDRLLAAFEEINAFVAMHGREPAASRDIQERKLYSRLQGLRDDPEKATALQGADRHGLLTGYAIVAVTLETVADVLGADPLGLLGDATPDTQSANSIFKLEHVTPATRASADLIAKRKPCKPEIFAPYVEAFAQVQRELASGERQLLPFHDKGEQLVAGQYYVLDGILLKLVNITFTSQEKTIGGKRFRKDGRTHCIFENGTESNMLYRSLAKSLYQSGRIVTATARDLNTAFAAQFAGFSDTLGEGDAATGFIYVLRSLSTDARIQGIPHLHKIGFSRQPVVNRIKNAPQEPTYLLAEVEVIAEYQVGNVNPQKLELLLHRFFAEACLNLDVFDQAGQRHSPREWFVVPLPVIDQAIRLLLAGQILDYAYDPERQQLVKRQSAQSGVL